MGSFVLALDQGTTSSRAILFDRQQNILGTAQRNLTQMYPQPGWVEQDPMEIFATQTGVMAEVLAANGVHPADILAIGIANQRETTIVWDKKSGRPIYNAIVWQCRRTSEYCTQLVRDGHALSVRKKTGLPIDAYFSATKIRWILDHVPDAQQRAEDGELLFGTVDSWLLWKMTDGRVHLTDVTNASRTMLFNIHTVGWDEELCRLFNIPMCILPSVHDSSEIYGTTLFAGTEIPIAGIAGDQQAALFGQACFSKGDVKNTYGTGCFMLMNTGTKAHSSNNGLLTTIAIGLKGNVQYALEGSVFAAGAAIQWLRDELGLISQSADSETCAALVPDTGGVYLVPAFTGLGAPYWDMNARGIIAGITRGTNKNHLVRAALESIAFQTRDVLLAMEKDIGQPFHELRVDGGACANDFLMQFQADITGVIVHRPIIRETTALGAAYLAGLAVGVWKNVEEIKDQWALETSFLPVMSAATKFSLCEGWDRAVTRAQHWIPEHHI